MIPAVTPAEREVIMLGVKRETPPRPFCGLIAMLRPHLDDTAWSGLACAVGVAQQPERVSFGVHPASAPGSPA